MPAQLLPIQCNLEGALGMKFVLTAIGAGIIATAMLSNPAAARPRCVWEGHHWNCWNSHSWHHGGQAWHHDRYGRHGENRYYGNSGPYRHDHSRYNRGDMHYGR